MEEFFVAMWHILLELAPWLLLGAAIGGVLHVVVPGDFLTRHLSGRGGVAKAVAIGVPLPLCSCGVIPVGLQLKKSGASNGAVVAFLISTPQTGVDSILVSGSMLGWPFAIFKVFSAAVTGLVGGWLTNASETSTNDQLPIVDPPLAVPVNRWKGFIDHSLELIRSIWGWVVVGIVVSAIITTVVPPHALESLGAYGGIVAMLTTVAIAVPLYVCAVGSVPIAAALVASGFPTGAALVFLMAGPAVNVATLGAVYRTLGRRPLLIYLTTIIVGSIACGYLFDFVINPQDAQHVHEHVPDNWWSVTSAVALLALFGWFAIGDARRLLSRWSTQTAAGPKIAVGVQGMTCGNCVTKLEKVLAGDQQVDSARVTLEPAQAVVHGAVSENRVRELIRQAGYHPV